jgi:hypothetical protein
MVVTPEKTAHTPVTAPAMTRHLTILLPIAFSLQKENPCQDSVEYPACKNRKPLKADMRHVCLKGFLRINRRHLKQLIFCISGT